MSTEILMPALSPTMEEGKLAKWLVKEGDDVHSGDILAEIETDKATMEFEAVDEGRIGKILIPEGTEGVKVNQPIAVLVQANEEAPTTAAATAKVPNTGANEPSLSHSNGGASIAGKAIDQTPKPSAAGVDARGPSKTCGDLNCNSQWSAQRDGNPGTARFKA